jgi:hypothetical protein
MNQVSRIALAKTQSPLRIILGVFAPMQKNKALRAAYSSEARPRKFSPLLSRQVVLKSSNGTYTKLITMAMDQN